MELSDELVARAEQLQQSYGPAVLRIRLDSPALPSVLASAARDVIEQLSDAELHWSVSIERAGVTVCQWGFDPDICARLAVLGHELSTRGLEGRMLVGEEDRPIDAEPLLNRKQQLLECHLRLKGKRPLYRPEDDVGIPDWQLSYLRANRPRFLPDDNALLAGLEAALAWIGDPPLGTPLWMYGPHRDADDVRARIAQSFATRNRRFVRPTVKWAADGVFRMVVVDPFFGDVSLAVGGERLANGDWEPDYEALLDALREAAGCASYGLIKRGRDVRSVGRSLARDWWPAPHYGRSDLRHTPYEDVLAPDAFGAQLLGSGYDGRIPNGTDWEQIRVNGGGVLLLHRDPAAWYAQALPDVAGEARPDKQEQSTPDVLVRARDDFADILITAEVVRDQPHDPLAQR